MDFKASHFKQNISYKARVGAAIFLTGTFLLASGILNKAYSQDNRTKKGGDTVLLMQTSSGQAFKPVEQAKKETTKTMDTIPKLVIPDVKTLEHYLPYSLTDSMFTSKDPKVRKDVWQYAGVWRTEDDVHPPFGLTRRVIDSYSRQDRKELERRWEIAKTELIVAFLSDRGATPSNALKIHTPEEVKKMLREWKALKETDKAQHDLLLRREVQPHNK